MLLTELANRNGTDKGTVSGLGHGYTLVYDLLFAARRMEPLVLCEIGLCIGGPEVDTGSADRKTAAIPSVRMWCDYFPKAQIVGVDISDFSAFEDERFRFVRADCGDREQLRKVSELGVQFDIIIDDGSHAAFHQQLTFLELFPLLKAGGFYVIEDLQWQPATYAGQLPNVPRTDSLLAQFIATGQFRDSGDLPLQEWTALEGSIASIFLFDEDWLYRHRRQYNRRNGVAPDAPTMADTFANRGRTSLGYWKRFLGRMASELMGPDPIDPRPRQKLAIIQKATADSTG